LSSERGETEAIGSSGKEGEAAFEGVEGVWREERESSSKKKKKNRGF